jgi:hypothetical protein
MCGGAKKLLAGAERCSFYGEKLGYPSLIIPLEISSG